MKQKRLYYATDLWIECPLRKWEILLSKLTLNLYFLLVSTQRKWVHTKYFFKYFYLPYNLFTHLFSKIPNWHHAHRKNNFRKPNTSWAKGKIELASINKTVASFKIKGGTNDFHGGEKEGNYSEKNWQKEHLLWQWSQEENCEKLQVWAATNWAIYRGWGGI